MNDKVCVIGGGPAGLLAALGAVHEGAHVTVMFPGEWSVISGAQYLHAEIPELDGQWIQPFKIRYVKHGTEEQYRLKVYGPNVKKSSWGKFNPLERAWDLRQAYEALQVMLRDSGRVTFLQRTIAPGWVNAIVDRYDYVFNTAPLRALAPEAHYVSQPVLILQKNLYRIPLNEIHYYGDWHKACRASNIQGHGSVEFPDVPSVLDHLAWWHKRRARRIFKPIRAEGVELDGVYRLGRFGKWDKDQLVHEAYFEARQILHRGLPWTATLPA